MNEQSKTAISSFSAKKTFTKIVFFLFYLACNLWVIPTASAAPITQEIKLDNFGYRTGDKKIAIFSANPGATVEVHDLAENVIATLSGTAIQSKGTDTAQRSGDTVWWVDFSSITTPGHYRLYSPTLAAQSYNFEIADDIYNDIVLTALKTFYLQRCNTPKLAIHTGTGWGDAAACHTNDTNTTAASGHINHGIKDLAGGWHDAGDYNKYAWSAVSGAILTMLMAYEDNPGVFIDGDSNIPESGNGRPDILDEIKWELDWLLKMQLSDGSVLYQTHVNGFSSNSPPSADSNLRYYQNPTLESGAVLSGTLALAARIFALEGDTTYSTTLLNAAKNTWTWLQTQGNSKHKVWAAAELFRADPTLTFARDYVDTYYGSNWSGAYFDIGHYDTYAALTYIQTASATANVVTNMRNSVSSMVNNIFSKNGLYRVGMQDWSYHWGSNAIRANYGLMLLAATKIGETGNYTAQDCREHAQDFLHFFHGQNPLNMVYMTNMQAQGGEHSSWQFYHAWYGDSRNTFSASNFIGKPMAVIEPDYPYFKGTGTNNEDNINSTYGPAPGFIPGGPNKNYSAIAAPPLSDSNPNNTNPSPGYFDRYYRDWNLNPVSNWQDHQSWEITENSIGYQGPYVALGAYFMSSTSNNCSVDNDCDDSLFCNGTETCNTSTGACLSGNIPCQSAGEICDELPDQCVAQVCNNNGICDGSEDCTNCSADCISGSGGSCGNGICELTLGEDCLSCAQDCRGKQNGNPNKKYCCGDAGGVNPISCGDNRCISDGFACTTQLSEAYCCGDTICTAPAEDNFSCALDCGIPPTNETSCSDGIDDDGDGLTDCADTDDCASDAACQSSCNNNGICEIGEDCSNCNTDCDGRTSGKPSLRYCCGDGISQSAEGTGLICDGNF